MRRATILIIILLSVLPKVLSQENLNIAPFFSSEFFEKNGVSTLTVTGDNLKNTGIATCTAVRNSVLTSIGL